MKLQDAWTGEQWEANERQERAERDMNAGKSDCKSGYYDKWYRYNRKDSGEAYDYGFKIGMDAAPPESGIEIIECLHN